MKMGVIHIKELSCIEMWPCIICMCRYLWNRKLYTYRWTNW